MYKYLYEIEYCGVDHSRRFFVEANNDRDALIKIVVDEGFVEDQQKANNMSMEDLLKEIELYNHEDTIIFVVNCDTKEFVYEVE